MEQRFLEQYRKVFDDNGNIRNCGRREALRLIELADSIEPGVSHGDTRTGFMRAEVMKELRERVTT